VKYCYEKELTKDPGLYGKVAVVFVIDGSGKVADALVQQSTMGSAAVEGCMLSHVRRWAFPAPEGGGTVQVTYPYVFKSSVQ
jgi:TonB family protein